MAVMLNTNPTLLLERFPRHVEAIKKSVDTAATQERNTLTLQEFLAAASAALAASGQR
jgi:hypothetical protein